MPTIIRRQRMPIYCQICLKLYRQHEEPYERRYLRFYATGLLALNKLA